MDRYRRHHDRCERQFSASLVPITKVHWSLQLDVRIAGLDSKPGSQQRLRVRFADHFFPLDGASIVMSRFLQPEWLRVALSGGDYLGYRSGRGLVANQ